MKEISSQLYRRSALLVALVPTCIITTLVAIFIDQILIENGIAIQPYFEAIVAGVFAFAFSLFVVPLLWRLGLNTLPLYLLGGLALIVPATIVSLAFVSMHSPVMLDFTSMNSKTLQSQVWALTIYVRFARSAMLLPIHITAFWLINHKLLKYSQKNY